MPKHTLTSRTGPAVVVAATNKSWLVTTYSSGSSSRFPSAQTANDLQQQHHPPSWASHDSREHGRVAGRALFCLLESVPFGSSHLRGNTSLKMSLAMQSPTQSRPSGRQRVQCCEWAWTSRYYLPLLTTSIVNRSGGGRWMNWDGEVGILWRRRGDRELHVGRR